MRALVTGGGGFLGAVVVRKLLARGDEVRSLSRGDYPALRQLGVDVRRGDLADATAVSDAVQGCDTVYHVAAKAGVWGPLREYHEANVLGTQNVLDACREHAVRKLVYTSTPSVVFAGRDQQGIDETEPFPDRYLCHYPRTKAIAERLVLESNGEDLATTALRPHLIWGPGDNHLVPRILERARAGRLALVGRRANRVDAVYVDDAAQAHLLAADRLEPGSPVAGRAYFISEGEPIPLADLINRILAAGGLPPVQRRVPSGLAHAAGAMLELVFAALRLRGEPPMTRFVARQLSTEHWFDLTAARRDLGYEPTVSLDEGMRRLAEWLKR